MPVTASVPDSENFDRLVFYPIHNQVWRLAYWPLTSPLHMSLSSDFRMFTQIACGFPDSFGQKFSRGWIISCDVVLGFTEVR